MPGGGGDPGQQATYPNPGDGSPLSAPGVSSAPRDARAIRTWLVGRIAERMALEPEQVDIAAPLADQGLDSLAIAELLTELGAWLGRPLAPTVVWAHPDIRALAARLAAGSNGSGESGADRATDDGAASLPGAHASPAPWDEPIAVVALDGRFPGAEDAEAFWALLREGRDAIRDVPAERWDAQALFDPDPKAPGKVATRWGGFLDEDRISGFERGLLRHRAARGGPDGPAAADPAGAGVARARARRHPAGDPA